eukprot:163557_1
MEQCLVVLVIGLVYTLCAHTVSNTSIPLPTIPQYEYQSREIVSLTCFNMATFFGDADPSCNKNNWVGINGSSNPKNFNPTNLNISNWVQSYKQLGVKSAVLTVKHGCGFTLWPTKVLIPTTNKPYTYSVPYSSYPQDIVKDFSDTLRNHDIGVGFYYSLTNNFYLNVYNHNVQPTNTLIPGQQNVTQQQFEEIAKQQLIELFTNYGNLTEFWFDGGTSSLSQTVKQLIAEYQPQMVIFNGQSVTTNVIRWVGTETGETTSPIWSLGYNSGIGDPNSTLFAPAGCDTTLQNNDKWFYTANVGIRSLSTLIDIYHDSCGNNCVLEMDYAIDETGNVNINQAERYEEFGNWIKYCYSNALNSTNGVVNVDNNNMLSLDVIGNGISFDRLIIKENLLQGQRVRQYEILIEGNVVYSSTAIGFKKIVLLKKIFKTPQVVSLKLNQYVGDSVEIVQLAVFTVCAS